MKIKKIELRKDYKGSLHKELTFDTKSGEITLDEEYFFLTKEELINNIL